VNLTIRHIFLNGNGLASFEFVAVIDGNDGSFDASYSVTTLCGFFEESIFIDRLSIGAFAKGIRLGSCLAASGIYPSSRIAAWREPRPNWD
jgi:hypothetical protein